MAPRCTCKRKGWSLYLYKVAQLWGNYENIRSERHVTEALELLIIHVNLLHGGVQWVVAESCDRNTSMVNAMQLQGNTETTGDFVQDSYLLWVSMCFSIRENLSDPVPLQPKVILF